MRSLFWVCSTLVVVLVVMSTNLWRELGSERQQITGLRGQLAAAQAEVLVARIAAAHAEAKPVAPVEAAQKKPDKPLATIPVRRRNAAVTTVNARPTEAQLLQDPEYRNAQIAALRWDMLRRYPGVAEELGLTADETTRFFTLLAMNQLSMTSQLAINFTSDEEANKTATAELLHNRQALQMQLGDLLRNLLGDTRYAQWQAYQSTVPVRLQANTYASVMAQAGAPMDATQLKGLVTAMLTEQTSLQRDTVILGQAVNPANPDSQRHAQEALQNRRADSNQKILDAAAGSLSAQQIGLLRTQFEQQNARNAASQYVRQPAEALQSP